MGYADADYPGIYAKATLYAGCSKDVKYEASASGCVNMTSLLGPMAYLLSPYGVNLSEEFIPHLLYVYYRSGAILLPALTNFYSIILSLESLLRAAFFHLQ